MDFLLFSFGKLPIKETHTHTFLRIKRTLTHTHTHTMISSQILFKKNYLEAKEKREKRNCIYSTELDNRLLLFKIFQILEI